MIFLLMLLCADWKVSLGDLSIYPIKAPTAAVSPENVLCLADNTNSQIVFLDSNGKLIVRKGAKGQGPEEFAAIGAISYIPSMDAFAIRDVDLDRISFWKADGTFITLVKLANWHTMQALSDKEGLRVDDIRYDGKPFNPGAYRGAIESNDSENIWSGKLTAKNTGMLANEKGWHTRERFAWAKTVHSVVASTTLAINDFDGIRVDLVNIKDGKKIASIKPDFQVVPVSPMLFEAECNKLYEYYLNADPRFKDSMIRLAIKEYKVPTVHPLVMGLLSDAKDRVWILGPAGKDLKIPYEVYSGSKKVAAGKLAWTPTMISKDRIYFVHRAAKESDDYIIESTPMPKGL